MSPVIPRIALTSGEPAGIGPDLIATVASRSWPAEIVALGDSTLIAERARQLGLRVQWRDYTKGRAPPEVHVPHGLPVLHIPLRRPVTTGKLNAANAVYVLDLLRRACDGCLSGEFDAVVTAPLHKGIINDAGIAFSGHTEFLADHTRATLPVMMLTAPGMRVALVTTHLPLSAVASHITGERVEAVLRILLQDLSRFYGLQRPRIVVCGLNPHAGEDGHLGREEIEHIRPVIGRLTAEGHDVLGPLPADTVFVPQYLESADAVLSMYHDQGLPVLKHAGFGRAVNVTLGLPIIRTSVDHGTALSLAGTGQADAGSLEAALEAAVAMIQFTRQSA